MTTSSAFPDWALLDRHVFRMDDDSFPADDPTAAACPNSRGDMIRVCFNLYEPPRPSRICLCWPAGTGVLDRFSVLAAHRDAVLFQMRFPISQPGHEYGHQMYDYFLYRATTGATAGHSSSSRPSLSLIPSIDGTIDEVRDLIATGAYHTTNQRVRRLDGLDIAVLSCGDDDFAVAELQIDTFDDKKPELHVFRPRSGRWEVIHPKVIHGGDLDLEHLFWYWEGDKVFPFGRYLCWVDYCLGAILLCNVLDDTPELEYQALPAGILTALDRDLYARSWPSFYHTVGVVEECSILKFVMITFGDGSLIDRKFNPASGFKVTSWTLKGTGSNNRTWEIDAIIKSDDLWALDDFVQLLPCTQFIHPVVSMVDPSMVYFVLCDEHQFNGTGLRYDETWLVGIDMSGKALKSSFPYIKSDGEDISAERAKSIITNYDFESFLASGSPST